VRHSTELRGHTGAVERVAWHPRRDAELASCSADGTVRLWDVRSKSCRAEIRLGGEGFTLAWSPDGDALIAGRKVRSPLLFWSLSLSYLRFTPYQTPSWPLLLVFLSQTLQHSPYLARGARARVKFPAPWPCMLHWELYMAESCGIFF
jgi:WD40 repeat protein